MSVSYLNDDPDHLHMRMAIAEARKAAEEGEVPVGAIIWHPDQGVIGRAYNQKESLCDATAHAEILAISQASSALQAWRLSDCILYSTLEPCPMCAGAIIQARLERCVFGAFDYKAGAVDSVTELFDPGLFNHDVQWLGGLLEQECSQMLSEFFQERRKKK